MAYIKFGDFEFSCSRAPRGLSGTLEGLKCHKMSIYTSLEGLNKIWWFWLFPYHTTYITYIQAYNDCMGRGRPIFSIQHAAGLDAARSHLDRWRDKISLKWRSKPFDKQCGTNCCPCIDCKICEFFPEDLQTPKSSGKTSQAFGKTSQVFPKTSHEAIR